MARPTKQGVDYFPVDVQFDDSVELFLAEYGAEGLGILVTIWQIIYKDNGYYTKNNDDLILLIRRRCMADINIIKSVISSLLNRGIFSKYKNSKHKILTSKGIQERYFIASKKKKTVKVDGNYICKSVLAGDNAVYSSRNATKEEEEEEEEVEVKVKANDSFLEFWNLYPRKVKKDPAKKWWLKNVVSSEKELEIIDGLKRLLPTFPREQQYITHPITWLNQGRWQDETPQENNMGSPASFEPRNMREAQSVQAGEIAKILLKERENDKARDRASEESGLLLEHNV